MSDMPSPEHRIRGTVIRVIDGDTIEIEVRRTVHVRILDCWAPETKRTKHPSEKALGIKALNYLAGVLQPADVCLLRIVPDEDEKLGDLWSHDRVVGDVWHGETRWLSDHMIAEGHAFKTKKELNEFLTEQDREHDDI